MKEKELEEKFRDAVWRAGGRAFKFVSPGNAGVPDRLVVLPGGKAGFVELKAPGKRLRPDQELQIRKLKNMGFVAMVLDDPARIPEAITAIAQGDWGWNP